MNHFHVHTGWSGGLSSAWNGEEGLPCQRSPSVALPFPCFSGVGVRRVEWAMRGFMVHELGGSSSEGFSESASSDATRNNHLSNSPSWGSVALHAGQLSALLAAADIPHNVLFAYTPAQGPG